jgi:hypothetical protein
MAREALELTGHVARIGQLRKYLTAQVRWDTQARHERRRSGEEERGGERQSENCQMALWSLALPFRVWVVRVERSPVSADSGRIKCIRTDHPADARQTVCSRTGGIKLLRRALGLISPIPHPLSSSLSVVFFSKLASQCCYSVSIWPS